MKRVTYLAAAAIMTCGFSFASCQSKTAENIEETTEAAVDDAKAEADSAFSSEDTVSVQDTTVKDGVVDKIEE